MEGGSAMIQLMGEGGQMFVRTPGRRPAEAFPPFLSIKIEDPYPDSLSKFPAEHEEDKRLAAFRFPSLFM